MKIPFVKRIRGDRILFFLTADIIFIIISVFLAFLLRFDGKIPARYLENDVLQKIIILSLIFSLPIFYFQRLYSFSWSYVSASELIALIKATAISFVFSWTSIFMLQSFHGFPRSVLIITYFLIFIFSGAVRFSKRIYLQFLKKGKSGKKKERTLIVGAGDAGEQILRSVLSSQGSFYLPIGFVDDNSSKQGVSIHGLKVLGKINDIPKIVKKYRAEGLIIALPSAGSEAIKRAVGKGRKAGLEKIRIVPSLGEIISGEVSLKDIKEIKEEDLLNRKPVILNQKAIEDFIRGKRILITGAAGSIGSELAKQVMKFRPLKLILLDQDETRIFNLWKDLKNKFPDLGVDIFSDNIKEGRGLRAEEIEGKSALVNIREKKEVNSVFSECRPNIVFHAAAFKHVPAMEVHPDKAVENNIFGTKNVAEAAIAVGTEKFIFISTDKAINPSSVMGATKRIGEMLCQSFNQKENGTKFISVRFGNVLGSRGSVIPLFKEQIKKERQIKVTHAEMKRYFMITSEAVLLTMRAAARGKGGEVFILNMGNPVKIIDLAKDMIRLSGLEPDKDVPIIFSGARPGEKFFEEILSAEEGKTAGQDQNIFEAKLSETNREKLTQGLKELREALDFKSFSREKIINILKKIVPTYQAR